MTTTTSDGTGQNRTSDPAAGFSNGTGQRWRDGQYQVGHGQARVDLANHALSATAADRAKYRQNLTKVIQNTDAANRRGAVVDEDRDAVVVAEMAGGGEGAQVDGVEVIQIPKIDHQSQRTQSAHGVHEGAP